MGAFQFLALKGLGEKVLMNTAIAIENVSKQFKNTRALSGVTFTVPTGKIFGLLGPNGAGKTTLMRILTGILGPDEGRVLIHNNSPGSQKERIGYLPEERGIYPKMKVKDALRFFASIKGVPKNELKTRIDEGIERVGLTEHQEKPIQDLSKGNQQRVQLLITLLHLPDIFILDEPFTSLDPIGVDQMKQTLLEETGRGATVVISTHRMEDAEQLCENIALIHKGKVIRCGHLGDIIKSEGNDELLVTYEGKADPIQTIEGMTLTSSKDNELRFQLHREACIPEIYRTLSAQLEVRSIARTTATLHDVFVQLVEQEDNEQ